MTEDPEAGPGRKAHDVTAGAGEFSWQRSFSFARRLEKHLKDAIDECLDHCGE
jgi:hypothetical protein